MSETRPRRSRLAQIKDKLEDDQESMKEELAKTSLTKKRQLEINEDSEFKAVDIKDPQNIEETTKITKKTLAMTETMMKRIEALEVQQTNNIGPKFTALEEKISQLAKNASEILESLKNQPQIQELDYKLDPEPQPEPEPEMEPVPELPPLPQLEDEPPLELDQESEPEIPPLPELKLPEEEKTEETPKPEVPKLDSETQTEATTLPEDEEREKRRAERRQKRNKSETENTITETCQVQERDIQFDPNQFENKKEENENVNSNANEVAQKEEIEQIQTADEKSVDVSSAGASGNKISFELIALIILIILEIAHLFVISK